MGVPGDEIRRLRRVQGLSQRSLARRAGCTQAAVSRIERGLTSPTWETLRNLILALGYEPGMDSRRLATRADATQLAAMRRRPPAERLALGISANRTAWKLRRAMDIATR